MSVDLQQRLDRLDAANYDESDEDEQWDLVIRPRRGLLELRIGELWQYRDLLRLFVRRDIVTVYKQTILGPLWFVIQPILTTAVYVLVFGNIAQLSTDGTPKTLFYMCGVVIWSYFAQTFTVTSGTFTKNAALFGKVYFPRLISPLSQVFSGLIKFGIQLAMFLVIYAILASRGVSVRPTVWLAAAPLLVALMAGLGLGFGLVLSSLTSKYRDLTFLTSFGVQLLMYGTPIIYPMSAIPEKYRPFIGLNPVSHIVETFKVGFLGAGQISVYGLLYAIGFTIALLFVGMVVFNKTEQTFMDTV